MWLLEDELRLILHIYQKKLFSDNFEIRGITQSQCCNIFNNLNDDTFSQMHLNIRSLNKHFDDLQLLLNLTSDKSPSIIGLSETWLTNDSHHPYSISNYKFISKNRQEKRGGGVALYVLESLKYDIHESISISNKTVESLFIEIKNSRPENVIVLERNLYSTQYCNRMKI